MAQFIPINPEGLSDRELLEAAVQGINNTHDCVHRLTASTDKGLADVNKKVQDITTEIGGLKAERDISDGRIEKLAKMFGAEAWQVGDQKVKPHGIGGWSGKKASIAAAFLILASLVAHASTYDFIRHLALAADAYLVAQAQTQSTDKK